MNNTNIYSSKITEFYKGKIMWTSKQKTKWLKGGKISNSHQIFNRDNFMLEEAAVKYEDTQGKKM